MKRLILGLCLLSLALLSSSAHAATAAMHPADEYRTQVSGQWYDNLQYGCSATWTNGSGIRAYTTIYCSAQFFDAADNPTHTERWVVPFGAQFLFSPVSYSSPVFSYSFTSLWSHSHAGDDHMLYHYEYDIKVVSQSGAIVYAEDLEIGLFWGIQAGHP